MVTGSQIYFARPDALKGTLIETIRWCKPTWFFSVPRVYEKLELHLREQMIKQDIPKESLKEWARKELGFENTYHFTFAASPLKIATIEFFDSLGIKLLNIYGLSETTGPINF